MNPLQYYIDLEKKSRKKFVADDLEAQIKMSAKNILIVNNENKNDFWSFDTAKMTYSQGFEKSPVFCMFSFDMRNCYDEKLTDNILEYTMRFSQKQKEELYSFGDSVLIIKDRLAFENRVRTAFNNMGIQYISGMVDYYNEDNSAGQMTKILDREGHIAFSKRKEYFELQQEYRILANTCSKEAYILDIGDISDISEILPIENLLNTEFLAKLTLIDDEIIKI